MRTKFVVVILIFFNLETFSQTIPWANQQAEFIFPIYFENGDGQKDTVYMATQNGANISQWYSLDSIYGERPLTMDTSLFNVYFKFGYDSTKANVFWPPNYSDFKIINARNVIFPVKISWDTTRFSFYHSLYQPRFLTHSVLQDGFNDLDMTRNAEHVLPLLNVSGGNVYDWFPLSVYFIDGETYHPNLDGFLNFEKSKIFIKINSSLVNFELDNSIQPLGIEIYDIVGRKIKEWILNDVYEEVTQFISEKEKIVIIKLITNKGIFIKKTFIYE